MHGTIGRTLAMAWLAGFGTALAAAEAGFSPCSAHIDIASYLPGGSHEDPDVAATNAEVDAEFQAALGQWETAPPQDRYHQIQLLGKLILFDKTLSVNKTQACTSCHAPRTGFTGGSSLFNQTIVAQPGAVPITNAGGGKPTYRIASRKPQTYGYAPFAPILHFNATQGEFYGGNFWDMRASGLRLGNPAAEQALGPPTNPLEMGLPDPACLVRRIAQSPYRGLFEQVWGAQSFAIHWPAEVDSVCATPGPAPANDPLPVHLSDADRAIATTSYDHAVMAIAQYEAGPEESPFSSKFDYALAHPDQPVLSRDELAGWALFRGKGRCNTCHLDGTASGQRRRASIEPKAAADLRPLFTDFTASNLGLPKNLALPFYCENTPDQFGFTANPAGFGYTDLGVGGFLRGPNNPNPDWVKLASQFDGKFRVPTLRNVDKRPRPDFVKAYMHNGYLKSLKEVVHFYNTRDVLARCPQGSPGEKVSCWPAPEVPQTMDTTIGNLGLTDKEEDQIVAFLKTLTDGYVPPPR